MWTILADYEGNGVWNGIYTGIEPRDPSTAISIFYCYLVVMSLVVGYHLYRMIVHGWLADNSYVAWDGFRMAAFWFVVGVLGPAGIVLLICIVAQRRK
jgi:hypothetical protein